MSGNTQTLYYNGVFVTSITDVTRNNSNSNTSLTLGARSTGGPNSSFFDGKIFNTQVYNRALSPFEVYQNYNAMKGRFGIPDIVRSGLIRSYLISKLNLGF